LLFSFPLSFQNTLAGQADCSKNALYLYNDPEGENVVCLEYFPSLYRQYTTIVYLMSRHFSVIFYIFFEQFVNFIDNMHNVSKNTLAKQDHLPRKGFSLTKFKNVFVLLYCRNSAFSRIFPKAQVPF